MRTPVRLKPDATDVTEAVARPRLAEWLLRRALPRGVRGETILGDPSRSGARAAGGAPRPFGIGDTRCLSRHVTAGAASAASSRLRPAMGASECFWTICGTTCGTRSGRTRRRHPSRSAVVSVRLVGRQIRSS